MITKEENLKKMFIENANRSNLLSQTVKKLKKEDQQRNLVVQEGETRVLSYKSDAFKSYYETIIPKSVDEIKDMIGIPDNSSKPIQHEQQFKKTTAKPLLNKPNFVKIAMPANVDVSRLRSRIISPQLLTSPDVGDDEKTEMMRLTHMAIKAYIYGDSAIVAMWLPTMEEYLKIKGAVLFVPIFNNIEVYNDATLQIAADTHVLYANDIRLYGTGKIICNGPTTFDSKSFEGFL